MSKINCNIIKDLLPSYIDGLTSQESNELIDTHLANCTDCTQVLSELSKTVSVDIKEANREINYLKKINAKKKKIFLLTVLACTILFAVIAAIGVKLFIIGSPVAYHAIDYDKTDKLVGIGTRFNPDTGELTIYGEILSKQKVFSGIRVQRAPGLANSYNVTVYAAQRYSETPENLRKFEHTIKIPDNNVDYFIYSVGKIPQDTATIWTNYDYLSQKTAPHLKKLTEYLTQSIGFSNENSYLMRNYFQDVAGDGCYTFLLSNLAGDVINEYAVSEDCERMYGYDKDKDEWTVLK